MELLRFGTVEGALSACFDLPVLAAATFDAVHSAGAAGCGLADVLRVAGTLFCQPDRRNDGGTSVWRSVAERIYASAPAERFLYPACPPSARGAVGGSTTGRTATCLSVTRMPCGDLCRATTYRHRAPTPFSSSWSPTPAGFCCASQACHSTAPLPPLPTPAPVLWRCFHLVHLRLLTRGFGGLVYLLYKANGVSFSGMVAALEITYLPWCQRRTWIFVWAFLREDNFCGRVRGILVLLCMRRRTPPPMDGRCHALPQCHSVRHPFPCSAPAWRLLTFSGCARAAGSFYGILRLSAH